MSLIWRGPRQTPSLPRRTDEAQSGNLFYIPVPIHRLKRLNPQGYDGPRVLWHDQLIRHGIDYRQISLPNAEWRSNSTLEMGFNWTVDNPEAMAQMGACICEAAEAAQ